jgi:hypothetical protein
LRHPLHSLFRGRANEQVIKKVLSMGPHDDEIRLALGGQARNLNVRLANRQPRLCVHTNSVVNLLELLRHVPIDFRKLLPLQLLSSFSAYRRYRP